MTAEGSKGSGTDQNASRKKRFILIVDEDTRDAFFTGMLLQNFGYNTSAVKSAEEALEFISVAVPSCVITELALQQMTGFDLMDRMKRTPALASIPVIVQTKLADMESEDRCNRIGCAVYLRKPVTAEEIFRVVQSVLETTPRQNIRIPVYFKASLDGAGAGAEFVTVLSDNGAFVTSLDPRPVGTRHSLTFMVENKRIVRAETLVLYTYGFGEGPNKEPGMGIKFLTLAHDDKVFLQSYIQERVASGVPSNPEC